MRFRKPSAVFAAAWTLLAGSQTVEAGPIAWGVCQSACNTGYVTCLAGTGYVAGEYADIIDKYHLTKSINHWAGTFTLGLGVPAAVWACSAIQGVCMAACTPLLVALTP